MDRSRPYRELTPAALIGGVLLGAVLNMGICFAGLQIGFTIVGSAVAAVLGFGVLRGILRVGSILEVNVFQTVASAVNTVNAGIIFTVPVLFLLGLESQMDVPALILATIAGSLLGTVMIIPLRKQIIDYERLRFPEGTAVAAILRSPGAGVRKSRLLLGGIAVSGLVTLLTKLKSGGATLLPEQFDVGAWIGVPAAFSLIFATSTLSLGAGFIAGRGGLVVLYGTLLNYWVMVPAAIWLGWLPEGLPAGMAGLYEGSLGALQHGEEAADFIGRFSKFTSRHVGIGMILGGAVAGILVALPALKAALASLRGGGAAEGERDEMPIRVVGGGTVIGLLLLLVAIRMSSDAVSWTQAVLCTLAGGLWLWLAGLVVAQTTGRTDWSPLSGLALIAIAIMMGILGTGAEMVIPAVTIGAAICVATSMCADMIADLKTGYLVGGKPRRQQVAQVAVAWIGPAIALATVVLLWKAYGFGPDQAELMYARAAADPDPAVLAAYQQAGGSPVELAPGVPQLKAPQAGALRAAIDIVQSGNVPLGKYLAGAAIGLLVSLLVSPGIGVMVGLSIYLPFEYMIVFGIGGLLCVFFTRRKGAHWVEDTGLPVAAGLIVGDALVNIGAAVVEVTRSL